MALRSNGWPWARFAVRPDTTEDAKRLVLGVSMTDCFEPGMVYEVQALPLDGFTVRRVGRSLASVDFRTEVDRAVSGVTWARTVSDIAQDGRHLITVAEYWADVLKKTGTPAELLARMGDPEWAEELA
jgi:hypothetical protein